MTGENQEYFVYPNHSKSARSYTSKLRLSEAAQTQLERLVKCNQPMATIGSLRVSQTGGFLNLGDGEFHITVIDVARNNTQVYRASRDSEGGATRLSCLGTLQKKLTVKGKVQAPVIKPKKTTAQGALTVQQRKRQLEKGVGCVGKRYKSQKPVDAKMKVCIRKMKQVLLGYLALAGQKGIDLASLKKQVKACTSLVEARFQQELEKFAALDSSGVYVGKSKFMGHVRYNRVARLCKFNSERLDIVRKNVEHVKSKGCFPDNVCLDVNKAGRDLDPVYLKKYQKIQNHQQYLDLKSSYMQRTQEYNSYVKELNLIKGKIGLKKALLEEIEDGDSRKSLAQEINQIIADQGDEIKRMWNNAVELQKERDVLLHLVNNYCAEYYNRANPVISTS